MAEPVKPIKRSTQLAPLSREHHEGLLFAWKIRQGLANGTDLKRIAAFVQWFFEVHLQPHFKKEEALLPSRLPEGNSLVARMIDEHQEIEALLHINESIPDPVLLEQLAAKVSDHIRFEERELFPFAEKVLPAAELDAILAELEKEPKPEAVWEDEFWVKGR